MGNKGDKIKIVREDQKNTNAKKRGSFSWDMIGVENKWYAGKYVDTNLTFKISIQKQI